MIVVRVELHSAPTGQVSEIGRMVIANDGTGDRLRGNYTARLMRRGSPTAVLRVGEVKDHARLSYSVWVLVAKALAAVGFAVRNDIRAPETTPDPANEALSSAAWPWDSELRARCEDFLVEITPGASSRERPRGSYWTALLTHLRSTHPTIEGDEVFVRYVDDLLTELNRAGRIVRICPVGLPNVTNGYRRPVGR